LIGSLGYSPGGDGRRLDALVLRTSGWRVEPLAVKHVFSSFFADEHVFPEGSMEFDSALLMRNVEHEWQSAPSLVVLGIQAIPGNGAAVLLSKGASRS
jgi:hypothetical protein